MKNNSDTKSSSTTVVSEKAKLPPAYYAQIAKVGHLKRKASTYLEETDFYSGIATELLALLAEAVELLQVEAEKQGSLKKSVSNITSRQHHLVWKLLGFWPNDTESQERISTLLDSPGLEKVLGSTPDGYTCLSSDLTLENVERIFAATRASNPEQ